MKKLKLSTIELVFVLIAACTLFIITIYQLSTAGFLPGNDPSVHLLRARQIIFDQKISYSEISWYPPFFQTIVAMNQIFAGTLDPMTAAFILKILIASFNILLMLSTYLLARKFFGIETAVFSTVFTIISVPLFEMIFWGGYANFMGLAYIVFIFYIMNKDLATIVKILLLFSGAFTLIMIHQLTAFVFVLLFIPVFLISSIGSKRKFITFLAVIIGGGLALAAWYARLIIEHSDIIIEYIFSITSENIYHIPAVSIETLLKNLGVTFFITFLGFPLIFIVKKKTTSTRDLLLIFLWFIIPLLFAESYLFGINLPYHRFVYFLATPIALLSGLTMHFSISKIPEVLESKLIPKISKYIRSIDIIKIIILTIVLSVLVYHTSTFLKRVETYPEFYERASISIYNSGLWAQHHTNNNVTVVTPRSPGSWFYVFSGLKTIQETDPLSSRSIVAESVLYSFYEIERSRAQTREFDPVSPNAGQALYVSKYTIWTKVMAIPNKDAKFIYIDEIGNWIHIPLSETVITTYWTQNTNQSAQLVTEFKHDLFTINKTVTVTDNTSFFNVNWFIQTHENLANAKLELFNNLDPSLDFKSALVPEVLEWQNPWDNPTFINKVGDWAIVQGSYPSQDKIISILDSENGIIFGIKFNEIPDYYNLGALGDRRINSLRTRFELGYLNQHNNTGVSYSLFVYSFEEEKIEQWTISELEQQFNQKTNATVYGRDFLTFIKENNIKFVAIDTQQVVSNIEATPALDKVYDNGRSNIYTTKR